MTRRAKEIIFGIHYLALTLLFAVYSIFPKFIDIHKINYHTPIPIIIMALFWIVGIIALLPTRDK